MCIRDSVWSGELVGSEVQAIRDLVLLQGDTETVYSAVGVDRNVVFASVGADSIDADSIDAGSVSAGSVLVAGQDVDERFLPVVVVIEKDAVTRGEVWDALAPLLPNVGDKAPCFGGIQMTEDDNEVNFQVVSQAERTSDTVIDVLGIRAFQYGEAAPPRAPVVSRTSNGCSRGSSAIFAEHASMACIATSQRPYTCLLYTSPSPRDRTRSRMPSSA